MTGQVRNFALGMGFAVHLLRERWATGVWRTDGRTRNGRVGQIRRRAPGPRILVHGVSVGEIHAVRPLVDALATSAIRPDVVVSASTETGFEQAVRVYGRRREVVRFPLDFSWMVNRFLDAVRPDLVVLAELELWPTFLAGCEGRSIPVCVVNGRMSTRSFRGYRRWRLFLRGMFRRLALVAAQTETYRERFVAMGVPAERVVVTGSLKWDAARAVGDEVAAREIAGALGIDPTRPLIVAGSTGPGEEAALVRDLPRGCQLLLAPRDPDRWDEVARLWPRMPRRSACGGGEGGAGVWGVEVGAWDGPGGAGPAVFLLDTIGELVAAYSLADFVFVGRSLIPMGGSNPLEAVALGMPTVIGPHCENFAGVVADLVDEGGIVVSGQPMRVFRAWLGDPAAARAVAGRGVAAVAGSRGAGGRTARLVLRFATSGFASRQARGSEVISGARQTRKHLSNN